MYKSIMFLALLLILGIGRASGGDWLYYAGDAGSKRHISLNKINGKNFDQLKIVWRYTAPDTNFATDGLDGSNRGTPLKIGNLLYYGSPLGILCAVDARNGEEVWTFNTGLWQYRTTFKGNSRGIAYWSDGISERIFFGTANNKLYSVDALSGQLDVRFGKDGVVDLLKGSDRQQNSAITGVTSPPLICDDVVIVGSAIVDVRRGPISARMPPGDVRGYDVHTGDLRWVFHTIPRNGEYGDETWENNSNEKFGAANVWAAMSADPLLGFVYLPVSTPSQDFFGGGRPGDNLFGDSLVCVKAATGERVWHFQFIHHGLWDYDPPAAPVLMDVEINGLKRKIVAQVTKQAFCYVFDRITGEPIWPIEEVPVPTSTIEGEHASLTQPIPTRPAAFDLQGLHTKDLIDFTPDLREEAISITQSLVFGSLFTPPSERGTVVLPGLLGGADWAGAAGHPVRGILYVPSKTLPSVVSLKRTDNQDGFQYTAHTREPLHGPQGLPITRPPYGRITAIDLKTGKHLWLAPLGRGPKDNPALVDLNLPDLGWPVRAFVATTPDLLLVAYQLPKQGRRHEPDRVKSVICAYDLGDGTKLGKVGLSDEVNGNMMSYLLDGRQYLVLPVNGGRQSPELIALSISR